MRLGTCVEVAFDLAYGRRGEEDIVPQRLHRVWVLLWRLPKDEVPFAVRIDQFAVLGVLCSPCVNVLIVNQVDCRDG